MQGMQMRLQRVVIVGALVISGVMLAYALGFSTDLYSLSYHMDSSSSLFYVSGAELYREAQPFNRELFVHTVALLVVCLTMFITLTHRRRLYYVSNYITSLAFAGYAAYLGQMLFGKALEYKSKYLTVDFLKMQSVTKMMNMQYTESTFMMDLGIVLAALLMVLAALIIINSLMKVVWMRKERVAA